MDKYELQKKMDYLKYTQQRLSAEIPCSLSSFNAKFNGKKHFDTYEIMRICDILGIADNSEKAKIFLNSSSQ